MAVKLGAIATLWIPPHEVAAPVLTSIVVQPAMAADANTASKSSSGTNASANKTSQTTNATANPMDNATSPTLSREQMLDKREADLRALEGEVDAKLKELRALESKVQNMLNEGNELQGAKQAHLLDVYTNMKPKQAAQVLETLDDTIAVKILSGMTGRKAGEILSLVRADRAAKLSVALTKLQLGPGQPAQKGN